MLKNYRVGFDASGLIFFLVVMIPNFVWFAVPAPNEVLRKESATAPVDAVASVLRVIFLAALCAVRNVGREKLRFSPLFGSSAVCVCLYFFGWALYYAGFVNPFVIILLMLPPCLAFILFALDRKNLIAVFPAICFTVCHLIYGFANFIL